MRAAAPVLLACLAIAGCGGDGGSNVTPPASPANVRLSSADAGLRDGAKLPARYGCAAQGESPPLRWSGVPSSAAEIVLLVTDPDAPGGRFTHWTVYGMTPATSEIPAGGVPAGAKQGRNDFDKDGWGAPCPPEGDQPHRYVFDLYWLRRPSGLAAGAEPAAVVGAIEKSAGGRGTLTARYGRSGGGASY